MNLLKDTFEFLDDLDKLLDDWVEKRHFLSEQGRSQSLHGAKTIQEEINSTQAKIFTECIRDLNVKRQKFYKYVTEKYEKEQK